MSREICRLKEGAFSPFGIPTKYRTILVPDIYPSVIVFMVVLYTTTYGFILYMLYLAFIYDFIFPVFYDT